MDIVMEYPEIKVETAEEEQLEDLIKEVDVERVVEGGTEPITGQNNDEDSSVEEDATARHGQIGKANTESGDGDKRKKDNQRNKAKGETGTEEGVEHIKGMDRLGMDRPKIEGMAMVDITEQDLETDKPSQGLQVGANRHLPFDHLPKDTLSPEHAQKQAQRLTPYFPDALYDLVFTLQEGRRLNDQRCSFRGRRRCHSEPNTYIPAHRAHRVHFSSMTSLQKDEFFDLVATSQGRRLDDQRAELHDTPPPKSKANKKRSSVKDTKPKKSAPIAVHNEDLYNMILISQAQGRLEEQRSAAPGPMDDEDFFSLLLSVQGGRMEDQRTELPGILGT
ncbi:G-protein-signaling modulator 2-like [Coregonus clupeaformis]|uniref:G-protein-signaling modulator 2-like n=1 Tax=Coregonus clupeaformis TaxID=59861 RepID=UPI001E1C3178|nr:G-protein-signaling modulator 2-like [Coregonus clupeaformis]XP_045071082.1 G-protein-signaling modulator 2-like [Coregonus clupeaformis]